jgi:hypothetical protein
MGKMKIEIKSVKLSDIKLNPDNPRRINEKQMERLVKSLQEFPDMMDIREIVVDETMMILGGNMRYLAFFGEYDFDALANSWDDLPLVDWGVDLPEDWLKTEPCEPADAEPQIDKAEELNKVWKVKAGDLWQIGEHRLLCGDSTKAEDAERVMGREKAQATICDPPYGVTKETWDRLPTQNDLSIWLESANGCVVAFGAAPPDCLTAVLSLKPQCERVYVWWNTFTLTHSEGAFWQWQPIYVWRREFLVGLDRDVIQMAANTGGDEKFHVTQKPVALLTQFVEAGSKDNEGIFDPFLGSGTTMVACQNLNRKCRGIEISPDYCAVILQRMTDAFPDIEIKKING